MRRNGCGTERKPRLRSAADVGQAQMVPRPHPLGENGAVFYPVLSAAYKLLKEAGRASVYLEGQENLLNYPEAERSFRTLLEFFADDAAVKRCISPKTERTTVLLGDDLPEYAMPGLCIMSKRYLCRRRRHGRHWHCRPSRMPYREMSPRLEYFALLLGECMSGAAIGSAPQNRKEGHRQMAEEQKAPETQADTQPGGQQPAQDGRSSPQRKVHRAPPNRNRKEKCKKSTRQAGRCARTPGRRTTEGGRLVRATGACKRHTDAHSGGI